jgi:hypothetical protein
LISLVAIIPILLFTLWVLGNPSINLLIPDGNARWIRSPVKVRIFPDSQLLSGCDV